MLPIAILIVLIIIMLLLWRLMFNHVQISNIHTRQNDLILVELRKIDTKLTRKSG